LLFTLVGVNDNATLSSGKVVLKLLNSNGVVSAQQDLNIRISAFSKRIEPCMIALPQEKGGYLMVAEFYPEGNSTPIISRRYLKIGDSKDEKFSFFEMKL
jgi:hypothetical protein